MASQSQITSLEERLRVLEFRVGPIHSGTVTALVRRLNVLEQKLPLLEEKLYALDFRVGPIVSTTVGSLRSRLNALEQKLLGEGGQGKAIGGRNTYDVGKHPLNVVPQWAK